MLRWPFTIRKLSIRITKRYCLTSIYYNSWIFLSGDSSKDVAKLDLSHTASENIKMVQPFYGFQSVCPMMENGKRFMKASWWDRLTEGDTESPLLFYNTFSLKKKQTNKKLCYLICQGSDNQKIPQIFMLGTCLRILLSSSFTCSF